VERTDGLFASAELARWLPTAQSVVDVDAALALMDMRTVAKALRDLTESDVADGEPLGPTVAYAGFELEGVSLADALERHGADVVRFAVLNAAAPAKPFAGSQTALDQASALLARGRDFAEPRIEGACAGDGRIDLGDGLRRRLAGWCDTAVERIGENLGRLDAHRATRNLAEMLDRLEDFDRRVVAHRGQVADRDAEALAAALLVFIRLLAPVAPGLAGDLWQRAGGAGALHEAAWPERQRAAAAA
jgi:leucyl-tRNA synthetase